MRFQAQIEDSSIHVTKLLLCSSMKDAKKTFRGAHKEKGITKPCKNNRKLNTDQSVPKPWKLILLSLACWENNPKLFHSLTTGTPGTEATLQGPIFLRPVSICGGQVKKSSYSSKGIPLSWVILKKKCGTFTYGVHLFWMQTFPRDPLFHKTSTKQHNNHRKNPLPPQFAHQSLGGSLRHPTAVHNPHSESIPDNLFAVLALLSPYFSHWSGRLQTSRRR